MSAVAQGIVEKVYPGRVVRDLSSWQKTTTIRVVILDEKSDTYRIYAHAYEYYSSMYVCGHMRRTHPGPEP